MKISLVITTYNWAEALAVVLDSVINQTVLPDEVIIADDGSAEPTWKLIKEYKKKLPIPLIHSWQEDKGFRAAMSRNRAFAKSSGDYIIMIDGDMVLDKKFVQSYKDAILPGFFIQGGRVITNKKITKRIIEGGYKPSFFSPGLRNRKNAINSNFLSKLFSYERNNDKATRSCNMGVWRKDIVEVNGFNNEFVGWGREDSDFVVRLLNAGKRRLYFKFGGIAYHLYHKENVRNSLPENDALLKLTIKNKLIRCVDGVGRFFNDNK
ncbi:glycosyltransferase family 2 protein [Marinospirillum minutulum]|uniref:glycosyltransferase family 2 protein n=1 Tax=Marinospirillum minutulum TaxID=64974 RepID=UPI000422EC6B|nr:glycosyltransferase family 2 protein [Marinospirillum minutulum]